MLEKVVLLVRLPKLLRHFLEGRGIGIAFAESGRELVSKLCAFFPETFVFLTLLCQDGSLRSW